MIRTLTFILGATFCASAQFPDFTPPTPLIGAIMHSDTAQVKRLLEQGANPNEGRFVNGTTPLLLALAQGNRAMAEALIAKGADVKVADAAGTTALMWAAYDEHADPAVVKKLIELGADPNTKNKMGDTALRFAMKRGPSPVVEVLREAGASDSEMIRQSVEKAIALLQKSGPQFVKVSGCVSCHNNSLPQMAFSAARARGYAVDPASADYQVKAVVGMFKPFADEMKAGTQKIPDPAVSVSYSLVGLAAERYTPDATTEAMAHVIEMQQNQDGSFDVFGARPPIESSRFTATALSVRALQVYGKNSAARIERARKWLATAKPCTNEDRAMQLLGLAWSDARPETMRPVAHQLIAEQRADGGWAQLPALETDSYATGMAMVALISSGQVSASDPAWQRGVAYLLRTQLEDGSWLVRSRAFPFQPYKESGFPHGKNQWISAAGTSWAAWALSMPELPTVQAKAAE